MSRIDVLGIPFYRFYYDKSKIKVVQKALEKLDFKPNPQNFIWSAVQREGMDKMLHDLPELKSFFGWINECLLEVKKEMKLTADLKIVSSWCNMNTKGQSFHGHTHPNCFISSNYYVSGWENDCTVWHMPNPYYDKTNIHPFGVEGTKNRQVDLIHREPTEPGKYIVFPPTIWHYAEQNTKDEYRYTIAINAFPTGLINAGGVSQMNIEIK